MRFTLIFLLFPFIGFSQSLKKADLYFNTLKYDQAITEYEKYIEKGGEMENEAMMKIADSYYQLRNNDKARNYYFKVYSKMGDKMPKEKFSRLLNTMHSANDKEMADELFLTYFAGNEEALKRFEFQKENLAELDKSTANIVNLAINTAGPEFGITVEGDKAIFTSLSAGKNTINPNDGFLNLVTADINPSTGQLFDAKLLSENVNSSYNDATLVYSKDGKHVFFSRNFLNKKAKLDAGDNEVSNVMIMKGDVVDDKIENITPLSFSNKAYNCSHPFVNAEGNLLFFASDMPGGFGGSDIYVVDLYNDGNTGTPINLGPIINTAGTELFPTVKGDTLFFSSDFHYGFGGLDIFYAKMSGKTNYSVPLNMGMPINSKEDDFGYIQLPNRTGYFCSNREGGKGSDDIYWFQLKDLITTVDYSGLVLTKDSDLPIPNAKVEVFNIYDEVIQELESDENGFYQLELPLNSQLKVVYSKPEYSTEARNITTPEKPSEPLEGNDVYLVEYKTLVEIDKEGLEKIKIEPIYFEYDKYDITPQAEVELNKVLSTMNGFPAMTIKIEAHTDSRGNDAYNLDLSKKRANATYEYLISKGISEDRIESVTGFGESRLINHCKNGVKCSEEEHAENRRSNFIVLER